MGKIADLYIRVSTDEQAEKGYSQRDQEERLRKYCNINQIHIREVVLEDHSAKTFDRPQWAKLLKSLRRSKGKTDLVLFTKWDRFSRNAGDAYQMISTLRKLGVEPQAVEQPLDLSIPENKMMLAFYLAAPEVENDRRSLNTFFGMRRAKKEGRSMGIAPIGYANRSKENGMKFIAPKEPEATLVRWIFEEVGRGIFNTTQVWKMAQKKGFTKARSQLWRILRNPVYCGKIFVPKYKDEESCMVDAQHEALISEELFHKVQAVLDGRGRKYRVKFFTTEELPLRGFLICPDCGKLLTGSKSKGRSRYYTYYHCREGCTHRVSAEKVNSSFAGHLQNYIPRAEVKKLYISLIVEAYREQTHNTRNTKQDALKQIKEYEGRLSYARELLVSMKIDPSDYREIKSEYGRHISKLEARLRTMGRDVEDLEGLLDKGFENMMKLDWAFKNGGWEDSRSLIGSIYPENLTFDGLSFRTARVNEVAQVICHINNVLCLNKNGPKRSFSSLSRQVPTTGFEPAHPFEHHPLKVACLPISPRGHGNRAANITCFFY
tara:strand:+ start:22978 stop:24618 length:1641 start_codon:yes stop_codon:yes gene_type:complete